MLALAMLALTAAAGPSVLDSFEVEHWGSRHDPGDPDPVARIPVGARVLVWRASCDQHGCTDGIGALADSVPGSSTAFATARSEVERIDRCFRVDAARTPAAVLSALFDRGAVAPTIGSSRPVVLVVSRTTLVPEYERCPRNDCFMDPRYEPRFVRFREERRLEIHAIVGGHDVALYVPRAEPITVTLALVDAPGADRVLAAATRGAWMQAKQIAAAAFAAAAPGDVRVRAAANLAVAAFFARDRHAVAVAPSFAGDSSDPAMLAALFDLAVVGQWADGSTWLGADPCR